MFQFWEAWSFVWGGLSPQKPPRGDGTVVLAVTDTRKMISFMSDLMKYYNQLIKFSRTLSTFCICPG